MLFRNIRRLLRSYLSLTTRERRGLLVLLIIIFTEILVLFGMRYHHLSQPPRPLSIEFQHFGLDDSQSKTFKKSYAESKSTGELFQFDPNTCSKDEWMLLGLSDKQAQSILNYVAKGGRFRKKEDLSKMYALDKAICERLEPFVSIKQQEEADINTDTHKNTRQNTLSFVDINRADSTELCKLKGIGPGRARMIVRYRESLGGFVYLNQLLEVYTIDSTLFNELLPRMRLGPFEIRKLNMNADTLRHPYLNRKASEAVTQYKKQHGPFRSIEDLKKVVLIDAITLDKLAPYLTFE
ncbi:MAG: helix-hairpin-helix domain-containing protein [Bacteroidota bacterium]